MPHRDDQHWFDKTEGADFVVCLACGHKARKLDYHIKHIHGLSATDYRFRYGRHVRLECDDVTRDRETRLLRKAQRLREEGTHLTCPVCGTPLKNESGLVHHVQRRCKQGSMEHKEWRDAYQEARLAHKTCRVCRQNKSIEAFGKAESCLDGRRATCSACLTERNKRANPTRIWETAAKYKAKPEVRAKQRDARLRKEYGISLTEYQDLLHAQGGKCAICGATDNGLTRFGTPANFHVDHDHTTGVVRGLLCFPCNKGVGMFRDDPLRLEAAAAYVRRNQ